ncbi:hypothetical protein O6H91_02G009000 [Diphasiastrum complanatum]|uniref:Uncharacterized protein n=1 Tax=Diphasiastrum complanatum TaxID=34168 RepID=A0ACC2ED24_DIPCM|nr:hypothetical protein O6H91_02G009000 [Diphasiastrum complanatum]
MSIEARYAFDPLTVHSVEDKISKKYRMMYIVVPCWSLFEIGIFAAVARASSSKCSAVWPPFLLALGSMVAVLALVVSSCKRIRELRVTQKRVQNGERVLPEDITYLSWRVSRKTDTSLVEHLSFTDYLKFMYVAVLGLVVTFYSALHFCKSKK